MDKENFLEYLRIEHQGNCQRVLSNHRKDCSCSRKQAAEEFEKMIEWYYFSKEINPVPH